MPTSRPAEQNENHAAPGFGPVSPTLVFAVGISLCWSDGAAKPQEDNGTACNHRTHIWQTLRLIFTTPFPGKRGRALQAIGHLCAEWKREVIKKKRQPFPWTRKS